MDFTINYLYFTYFRLRINTIVKKTKGCSDSFLCILMKMLLSHRFEAKKVKRLNREKYFHLRSFD